MGVSRLVQRFCAIALVAIVGLFIYMALIHWWLVAPLQQVADDEGLLLASYQRFAALEAQRSMIQTRLEKVRQHPLPMGSLLVANGPEAAMAQLMQLVSERISRTPASGLACSLMNRLPRPNEQMGQLLRIQMDVELECGIESLAQTMHRLESEPPYLKVEAFSIRSMGAAMHAPTSHGRLAVRLQVSGFLGATEVAKR